MFIKFNNICFRRERESESGTELPANIFSNDGSFLQQFQKISGIKGKN